MKRNIKLTESQFNKFIVETCKKVLNEDMTYMSDEDIANQYSDMKITYFEINPLRNSEGWEGTFELEFPNADDIDYDSTMVNDFFVYDNEGNRIAWDYWMPDEQTKYLNDIIRKEIAKRNVKESIDRRLNEIGDTAKGQYMLGRLQGRQMGNGNRQQGMNTHNYASRQLGSRTPRNFQTYDAAETANEMGYQDERFPQLSQDMMTNGGSIGNYQANVRNNYLRGVSEF